MVLESILSTQSGVGFEELSSHPVVKIKVSNNKIDTFVFIVTSAIKLLDSKLILIFELRSANLIKKVFNMKLYLIHVGFYDPDLMDGLYEQHGNYFIAADSAKEAKTKISDNPTFKHKKMHIDGIKEVNNVDGYQVILVKDAGNNSSVNYSYDEVKKLK